MGRFHVVQTMAKCEGPVGHTVKGTEHYSIYGARLPEDALFEDL
jgi:hypothetical protein